MFTVKMVYKGGTETLRQALSVQFNASHQVEFPRDNGHRLTLDLPSGVVDTMSGSTGDEVQVYVMNDRGQTVANYEL